MQLEFALLCDAVTQREGLLNILGAGVGVAEKSDFPAPIGVDLAISLFLDEAELDRLQAFGVSIVADDGTIVGQVSGQFSAKRILPKETIEIIRVGIPVKFPPNALLPSEGRYNFEVQLNDKVVASVPLLATRSATKTASPLTA